MIDASTRAGVLLAAMLGAAACAQSPYVNDQGRALKALSADEAAGYLEGRGLGLAKPAELNGYPGPMHVLELADALALTPAQTRQAGAQRLRPPCFLQNRVDQRGARVDQILDGLQKRLVSPPS